MKTIILASTSPRRKELLKKAGIGFKIVESGLKETFNLALNPRRIAENLSLKKAQEVLKKYKNSIIIAADTLVACQGKVFGKPKDEKDVRKMLGFLSGKIHSVITGFTIIGGAKTITKSEETKVFMREIDDREIDFYIETGEPFDKAGGYAIQGKAEKFIEKVEGNLSNAIGLPLNSLLEELKKFGVK